ncbi:hypothetical protein XELAEV_18035028mg [Xenopus laevis]|uniref:Uncharacterized protein n=1 Tax=Xenopus laevis TaxID=8355 RepID=A0A974CEY6_XENLA|nr:hypothetical protein XELAEV_18035028mg [Xenopus laevis]
MAQHKTVQISADKADTNLYIDIKIFTNLSILLNVYCEPCFVSISKSNKRVVVVPRAKLIHQIEYVQAVYEHR